MILSRDEMLAKLSEAGESIPTELLEDLTDTLDNAISGSVSPDGKPWAESYGAMVAERDTQKARADSLEQKYRERFFAGIGGTVDDGGSPNNGDGDKPLTYDNLFA